MKHTTSRRVFLQQAGVIGMGFAGLRKACAEGRPGGSAGATSTHFGPLTPDPKGVFDLPAGFSYRVLSRAGERMDDGLFVPAKHDGMAAFPGPPGKTILVRNHECVLEPFSEGAFGRRLELLEGFDRTRLYDAGREGKLPLGGTTTLVYDHASRSIERHFLSMAGTLRNCAGGSTPWGSWITCEEATDRAGEHYQQDHGYNFEVPATTEIGVTEPRPLRAMGRFRHEAVAVDPRTGIVYQTEDMDDGLIYRFRPNEPGNLSAGGRLQALAIRDWPSCDTRNWKQTTTISAPGSDLATGSPSVRSVVTTPASTIAPGTEFDVRWIDLDDVEAADDDLRYRGFEQGAARFARGEGMWFGNGAVYFACTTGGHAALGQIWRYRPNPKEGQAEGIEPVGRLELFIEPNDGHLIENCDNLTVAPWGDLVITEDGPDEQYVLGVTPAGEIYRIGRNAMNHSELAGATFSPDGSTLFVNIYQPGLTLAITGPWQSHA